MSLSRITHMNRRVGFLIAASLLYIQIGCAQELGVTSLSQANIPSLPQANVRAAADYSREHQGHAFLLIQNGRVICEEYTNGWIAEAIHPILSGTKAVWTLSVLALADQGLLTLDERAADTLTEWRSDPEKSQITVRQLLNFTSGLPSAFALHGDSCPDRVKIAMGLKLLGPPGTHFAYGPSHLSVLYEILRRKLRRRGDDPWDYMERTIARPLGLPVLNDRKDRVGTPLLAAGFKFTAREWARLGVLINNRGVYRGKPLISRAMMSQLWNVSDANPSFGLTLWVNKLGGRPDSHEIEAEQMLDLDLKKQHWSNTCLSHDAPTDMIISLGSGFQRLIIVPSMNLVVVRLGHHAKFSDVAFLKALFKK